MQNPASFHNLLPPANQVNALRGISPEHSPSMVHRNLPATQIAGYVGSAYPGVPGLQYPLTYPGGLMSQRNLGNSHGMAQPINVNSKSATSASISTSSGGQLEGCREVFKFVIYHLHV